MKKKKRQRQELLSHIQMRAPKKDVEKEKKEMKYKIKERFERYYIKIEKIL